MMIKELAAKDLFQSAPLTDVRGDQVEYFHKEAVMAFQSAPLTDVRGDDRFVKIDNGLCCFNLLPSRM